MALNLAAAQRLAKTLDAIRKEAPRATRKRFAQFVTNDLKRALIAGVNPYGTPHAPLSGITIRIKGHAKILWHRGRLLRGMRAVIRGARLLIRDATPYGSRHITGDQRPIRAWAPVNGVPKHWRKELLRIAREEIAPGEGFKG